jgi:hypothetical protein
VNRINLDNLVQPHAISEFMSEYVGRKLLYCPGGVGRFSELCSWRALNTVLNSHTELAPPRVRLVKVGEPLPHEEYTRHSGPSGSIQVLSAPKVRSCIDDGATLVVDRIHEMWEPIGVLVAEFERLFQVPIGVNLYAACRSDQGFDLHWDDHDVFILQIAGSKFWQVYGETARWPIDRHIGGTAGKPTGPAIWERQLQEGDVLYLPRGWWHVATPCSEPTMHLSVGIRNPLGANLLGWVIERLKVNELIRQDVPRLESKEVQGLYLAGLRSLVSDALSSDRLIGEYQAYLHSMAPPRSVFSVGEAQSLEGVNLEECRVALCTSFPLQLQLASELNTVDLRLAGRVFTFPAAALQVFEQLSVADDLPVSELLSRFEGAIDREELFSLLSDLARIGLISFAQHNRHADRDHILDASSILSVPVAATH